MELTVKVPPEELAEASKCKPCGRCAARLYLEGRTGEVPGAVHMALADAATPPEAKRQKAAKTAADLVAEFAEIRECVAQGLLTPEDAREMCARLVRGE